MHQKAFTKELSQGKIVFSNFALAFKNVKESENSKLTLILTVSCKVAWI